MVEYGGYLPLELCEGRAYFDDLPGARLLALNSGRCAISLAAQFVKPKKLYVPYYNCHAVIDSLRQNGIAFELYYLNSELEPQGVTLKPGEWLLYVNYFGNKTPDEVEGLYARYQRVIFDNTQAFFLPPCLKKNCYNVYSCRKFFGVSDGAYLVYGEENPKICADGYPMDNSSERSLYLMRSLEEGTNAAYAQSVRNEELVGRQIMRMSPLTRRILGGIDYEQLRARRSANISVLHQELGEVNEMDWKLRSENLMVYPLYIENDSVRKKLLEHRVYVPQWWKYLLDIVAADTLESRLSKWLYALPIDQRYSQSDMRDLAGIVRSCL